MTRKFVLAGAILAVAASLTSSALAAADDYAFEPVSADVNRGATTAPLDEPGRASTICSWPLRNPRAAALSAVRESGGSLAIISAGYPCENTGRNSFAPGTLIHTISPLASIKSAAWTTSARNSSTSLTRPRFVHNSAALRRTGPAGRDVVYADGDCSPSYGGPGVDRRRFSASGIAAPRMRAASSACTPASPRC